MAAGISGAVQHAQQATMRPETGLADEPGSPSVSGLFQRFGSPGSWSNRHRFLRYGLAPVIVAAAFALRQSLGNLLGSPLPPYITFYPAVMFLALVAGGGPGLVATLLAALVTQYWILEPVGHWHINAPADLVALGMFTGIGMVMSTIAGLYRRMRDRLEELVAARTATLTQTNEQLQREIAERTRAEAALHESAQRLQMALAGGRMGMWEWDVTADRSVWNRTEYELLGLPVGNGHVSTDSFFQRVHPEDYAVLKQNLTEVVEMGNAWADEFRVIRPDGQVRWLAASAQILRDDAGRPVRLIGVNYDISDRKRAEEGLKAAIDSAESAKVAAELANRAKDHFLAVLSHELRTPLTPVTLAVSMLQDAPDISPAMREMLGIIHRNTELETRLIDDLLDVTSITRGKIQLNRSPVELGSVIQQAVEVCRTDIESRRLHFGVDLGRTASYWVNADPARLQQVLWNLLKNAIKFTPDGGCVGIRCRPDRDHVIVEVNDSGIGIEPEAMSRIFDAFEQAERSLTRQFGGLGLGLTIAKALVEMHGGTIEAQSEGPDRGTTFRIRLPRVAPPAPPELLAGTATGHRADRALRILMVEDHAVTAKMLRMLLTSEGHAVETAGDVATALESATQHLFDLLISDLGLPDGSGHDLLRELRARGCGFPAIALSGFGQEEDIHRSQEAGFVSHLTKPASPEALLDAIAAAMPG